MRHILLILSVAALVAAIVASTPTSAIAQVAGSDIGSPEIPPFPVFPGNLYECVQQGNTLQIDLTQGVIVCSPP
ncbi:MAG: hypothetical protein JOZ19_05385 [Rubrobacter sp.]|nr:hypothetical protein [Rubrobacter sp.]